MYRNVVTEMPRDPIGQTEKSCTSRYHALRWLGILMTVCSRLFTAWLSLFFKGMKTLIEKKRLFGKLQAM